MTASDSFVAGALIQKPFFSPPKSNQTSAAAGHTNRRASGSIDDLNLEHFATM
jgi:hypothetical protein